MTQEEKQLLLKDLCARLPYGVKVDAYQYSTPQTLYSIDVFRGEYILENGDSENLFVDFDKSIFSNIKPYLRPLSSMTEEEKEEYYNLQDKFLLSSQYPVTDAYEMFDWLNKKMFDYRGLIPMGLGIDCTGLNIY